MEPSSRYIGNAKSLNSLKKKLEDYYEDTKYSYDTVFAYDVKVLNKVILVS